VCLLSHSTQVALDIKSADPPIRKSVIPAGALAIKPLELCTLQ